jgi:hypothetical protein
LLKQSILLGKRRITMISKYDEQDGEEDEDDGGRERRLEVIYSYLKCSLLWIGIYPNLILVTTSLLLSSPLVSSPLLSYCRSDEGAEEEEEEESDPYSAAAATYF